jgi:hypothetical protein
MHKIVHIVYTKMAESDGNGNGEYGAKLFAMSKIKI